MFHSEDLKCLKMEKTLNLVCMKKIEECPTLFLKANYFLLLDRVVILCKKRGEKVARTTPVFKERRKSITLSHGNRNRKEPKLCWQPWFHREQNKEGCSYV